MTDIPPSPRMIMISDPQLNEFLTISPAQSLNFVSLAIIFLQILGYLDL